jgi:hypothetical protein
VARSGAGHQTVSAVGRDSPNLAIERGRSTPDSLRAEASVSGASDRCGRWTPDGLRPRARGALACFSFFLSLKVAIGSGPVPVQENDRAHARVLIFFLEFRSDLAIVWTDQICVFCFFLDETNERNPVRLLWRSDLRISSTNSSTSTRGKRRRFQVMQKMTKSKTKMQKRLPDLDSYGWKRENAKNDQRLKLKNGAI